MWEGVVLNLSKVSEEDVSCESDHATILTVELKYPGMEEGRDRWGREVPLCAHACDRRCREDRSAGKGTLPQQS